MVKKLKKKIVLLIVLYFGFFFFNLKGDVTAFDAKKIIAIFSFYEMQCSMCIDNFISFCDYISKAKKCKSTMGILINEHGSMTKNDKELKILKKKLRGFIKGNKIRFPIKIDKNGIFSELKNKIDLIVEDKDGIIRGYKYSEFFTKFIYK